MAATLYFSIVTSALGMAYIVYGRRQAKPWMAFLPVESLSGK